MTETVPGDHQDLRSLGREMSEVVSLLEMVSEVSYHAKECMTLRLFLSLPKYVLSVELGVNQAREPGRISVLVNEAHFGFCGEIDHCEVFKWPEAGFWKWDHVKGES